MFFSQSVVLLDFVRTMFFRHSWKLRVRPTRDINGVFPGRSFNREDNVRTWQEAETFAEFSFVCCKYLCTMLKSFAKAGTETSEFWNRPNTQ